MTPVKPRADPRSKASGTDLARRPRVLFAALYSESQAGTRLRAAAWCDALRDRGLDPEVWSFFSPGDSEAWFGEPSPAARARLLARALARTLRLYARVPRYDVVVVLREVAPLSSAVLERRIARRSTLVWDVDDAIWTPYPRMFLRWIPESLRRSEKKYTRVAALAASVWAGSEEIATWCRQHAEDVWVLPTVPVLPSEPPPLAAREGAVWVGSQSTREFLEQVLPDLAEDTPNQALLLTVVGADVATLAGTQVASVPWSEAAEDAALRSARVGLYPLNLDHPLAPARAGFKAALYMAYGLPCVVTPVPAVARIVRHGVDGLHASTPGEWRQAVTLLLEDDEAWKRMSAAARTRSEGEYCTAVWAPRVAERLQRLLIERGRLPAVEQGSALRELGS
jgi:glycosyltransferase involved in cell wall biosynthesis